MPNQQNFKQDIAKGFDNYSKFTVSRVFTTTNDTLLQAEVPADFPNSALANNVEINLYSLADNSLIYSDFISNSITGAISTQRIQYSDNTYRTFLYLDFSKLTDLFIPSGQYSVSLNFLSDELGSFDDRTLKITKISNSRKEVELEVSDTTKLKMFALPALNTTWVGDAVKQVFNQPNSNQNIPTIPNNLTTSSINNQLSSSIVSSINKYNFDEGTANIYAISQNILNTAYVKVNERINQLNSSSRMRFTNEELNTIITTEVSASYVKYINDNALQVSQLPYALSTGE
jgi:hypothetical protein